MSHQYTCIHFRSFGLPSSGLWRRYSERRHAAHITFNYQTPPLIDTVGPYRRYHLEGQKQPGSRGNGRLPVTLPADGTAIGIISAPAASYNLDRPTLEFRLTMETDQWIEIAYKINGI